MEGKALFKLSSAGRSWLSNLSGKFGEIGIVRAKHLRFEKKELS